MTLTRKRQVPANKPALTLRTSVTASHVNCNVNRGNLFIVKNKRSTIMTVHKLSLAYVKMTV